MGLLPSSRRSLLSRLLLLAAFGVAFGHIEAVVAVYTRHLLGWVPVPADIGPADVAKMPNWLLHAEQTREVATVIVLLALATLVGRNFLERVATFLLTLGVWDIAYYVALKAMSGWPQSFTTTDCLVVIPDPWFAPVWIPIVCSAGMIAVAVGTLYAIAAHSAR
jgi:hypothetical protein